MSEFNKNGNNINLAVDCGKAVTKVSILDQVTVVNGDVRIIKNDMSFMTRVKYESGLYDAVDGIHRLEYCGKKYVFGDMIPSRTTSITDNSKQDINHKVCTIAAISMAVSKGDSVCLAIGCPLQIYANKEKRQEYLEYIAPKGWHEVVIDGEYKYFYIQKAICYAESTGITITRKELFDDCNVGIIDIGGLNVNAALLISGKLQVEKCFTSQEGYYSICDKLAREIEKCLEMNEGEIDKALIENIIRKGYVEGYREQTEKLVANVLTEHLDNVMVQAAEHKWTTKLLKLVFVGGTAGLLREYISKKYKNAVVVDVPQYANVEGFLDKLVVWLIKNDKIVIQ